MAPMMPLYSQHPFLQEQFETAAKGLTHGCILAISGPSGCGKTHFVRALHQQAPWRDQAIVFQEAASLTSLRFESQLFGHVKGAFSGADRHFAGLAALAGQGLLVFDGLEDLAPQLQAKMLRFIQERRFRPVGGAQLKTFEGALVFCSRFPLQSLLAKGLLREDFYFRIALNQIQIPGFEARPKDVPHMIRQVAAQAAAQTGLSELPLSSQEVQTLAARKLPGNGHGYFNLFMQAAIRGVSPLSLNQDQHAPAPSQGALPDTGSLKGDLALVEKQLLERVIARGASSRDEMARQLGISRRALLYKLKEHDLN